MIWSINLKEKNPGPNDQVFQSKIKLSPTPEKYATYRWNLTTGFIEQAFYGAGADIGEKEILFKHYLVACEKKFYKPGTADKRLGRI